MYLSDLSVMHYFHSEERMIRHITPSQEHDVVFTTDNCIDISTDAVMQDCTLVFEFVYTLRCNNLQPTLRVDPFQRLYTLHRFLEQCVLAFISVEADPVRSVVMQELYIFSGIHVDQHASETHRYPVFTQRPLLAEIAARKCIFIFCSICFQEVSLGHNFRSPRISSVAHAFHERNEASGFFRTYRITFFREDFFCGPSARRFQHFLCFLQRRSGSQVVYIRFDTGIAIRVVDFRIRLACVRFAQGYDLFDAGFIVAPNSFPYNICEGVPLNRALTAAEFQNSRESIIVYVTYRRTQCFLDSEKSRKISHEIFGVCTHIARGRILDGSFVIQTSELVHTQTEHFLEVLLFSVEAQTGVSIGQCFLVKIAKMLVCIIVHHIFQHTEVQIEKLGFQQLLHCRYTCRHKYLESENTDVFIR